MRRSQLLITLLLLVLLLGASFASRLRINYGAVPWYGWAGLSGVALALGLGLVLADTLGRRRQVLAAVAAGRAEALREQPPTIPDLEQDPALLAAIMAAKFDPEGPSYPHPVINVTTCIGCHACVEACPHAVLAIVNGKATPIALEQCMEDTSCQVECPTVPKSCVVVNTQKEIPARKVPERDRKYMTNVAGLYLIGDVSGVPLIKNAINEGGAVIDYVAEDLRESGGRGKADYDVAIVGVGPAGLSATALARQRGLKYLAIEQDQVVATIRQTYQAGKYVYFNPADQETHGGIALAGPGAVKEAMIESWMETMGALGLEVHEYESCKGIKPEDGHFVIDTEQDRAKLRLRYTAWRVILAIGNRGTPMRLRVPGEELRITVTPSEAVTPTHCTRCGAARLREQKFCHECGTKYVAQVPPPYEDEKVKYKLSDPNDYRSRHCLVVGAGNSAVEAAVDLAAHRSPDGARIVGWRDNTVSLVIRSDFKSDLKLGNKMLAYDCIDAGRIKAYFGMTVKEITPGEVALMSARAPDPRTAPETARLPNDYVFALIGGEKPTNFLEAIGVKVG